MEIPLGPWTAFDEKNGIIAVLDEKRNKIVFLDLDGESQKEFAIPPAFSSTLFYWSAIHFLNQDKPIRDTGEVLLCLLKSHSTRVFHILSLSTSDGCVNKLSSLPTRIYSTGLRVMSHRAGSQFVFSFSNGDKPIRASSLRRRPSDRKLFNRQLRERMEEEESEKIHQRRASEGGIPLCDIGRIGISPLPSESNIPPTFPEIPIGHSPISSPITEELPLIPTEASCIREGVILVVRCTPSGVITATVLSLGKTRFGVKLRRVNSAREIWNAIGIKFMTKWRRDDRESFCEPFLSGRSALLLCRNDPSTVCIMPTVSNPKFGLLAAIGEKLRDGLRLGSTVYDGMRVSISGDPPSTLDYWSSIDIAADKAVLLTWNRNKRDICILTQYPGGSPMRLRWEKKGIHPFPSHISPIKVFLRCRKLDEDILIHLRIVYKERGQTISILEKIHVCL